MTDRPTIDPQVFSKRASQPVPRLDNVQISNLRAAPRVTSFAADSVADSYISMADDAKRLQVLADRQFNVSQQMFDENLKEVQEAQMIEAEGALNKILMGAETEIQNVRLNSSIDGVADASMEAYDKVSKATLDGASLSAFQQKYLAPKLEKARLSVAKSARAFQRTARQEEARHTLKETLEAREFLANAHPDQLPLILEELDATIDAIGANLPQTERMRLKDAQAERLTIAAVTGQIKTNPGLASQQLSAGAYNNVLNLKQVQALQADASAGVKKLQAEANKVASAKRAEIDANLGVAISVGEPKDLPSYAQLDAMRESGTITDSQWESHTKALAKRLRGDEDKNESLNMGALIFENKLPVNTENNDAKKAFNEYYNNQQDAIAQMPLPQRIEHSVNIIKTHRAVPDLLKGEIKLAAQSGDPEQVKIAADVVDRVAKEAPYLLDQVITTKDRQRIDMINQRLNIGMEPKEAIIQTDQQLSILNQASNESISQELSNITSATEFDYREKTKEAFTGTFDFLPFVSNLNTEGQSAFDLDRATAVYRIAFEDAYRQTRDVDLAEKKATEAVQGRFGRTDINGNSQTMEFPPERYYSIEGEDNDWMRKQMLSEVKRATKNGAFDPKTLKDFDKRVRLLPDPYLTPRLAAKGRPGYNLVIIGNDGLPRQLNPQGQLFFFDTTKRKEQLLNEARGE